jgi:sec-independent protein translocase protein TatA
MGSLSLGHWIIVFLVLLLLFGSSRLADVGKGLGEGIRNFKKGLAGDEDDKKDVNKQLPAKTKPADEPEKGA